LMSTVDGLRQTHVEANRTPRHIPPEPTSEEKYKRLKASLRAAQAAGSPGKFLEDQFEFEAPVVLPRSIPAPIVSPDQRTSYAEARNFVRQRIKMEPEEVLREAQYRQRDLVFQSNARAYEYVREAGRKDAKPHPKPPAPGSMKPPAASPRSARTPRTPGGTRVPSRPVTTTTICENEEELSVTTVECEIQVDAEEAPPDEPWYLEQSDPRAATQRSEMIKQLRALKKKQSLEVEEAEHTQSQHEQHLQQCLSGGMEQLLRERPEDPVAFLAEMMMKQLKQLPELPPDAPRQLPSYRDSLLPPRLREGRRWRPRRELLQSLHQDEYNHEAQQHADAPTPKEGMLRFPPIEREWPEKQN